MNPRTRGNERGAALVLALIFLTVGGVTVGSLLTYMNTNSAATTAVRVSRGQDYDALSAMQAAIASVRIGNTCGTGASGFTPSWTLNNTARPLRVDCSLVAIPIFDSTITPLPKSMPSIAYQARSTAETGDEITFAGTQRRLSAVTVTLEDWAKRSDWMSYPVGAWQHPITLKMYTVNTSGATPAPGQLIVQQTQNASIPWRPEADPTCATPSYWRDSGTGLCYSSVPVNLTWDLSSLNVDLPDQVIVSVAFSTQSYGTAPIGVDGPYNSLNFAVSTTVATGTNTEADALFYNSTFAGFYADGGAGGTGTFRRDTNWTPYSPAVQVVATDIPTAVKRNYLFSVCPSSVSAPCPDSQSLLRSNITFYDGQAVGKSISVQTWSK